MFALMESIVKRRLGRSEALEAAKKFADIESKTFIGVRKHYHHILVNALSSGDYKINVPFSVRHLWNESADSTGNIYVATATTRPNQIKIGATGNDVRERLNKYESKYGYSVTIFWERKVLAPFKLENRIATLLRHLRVSGLSHGDSIEWYFISAEEAKSIIMKEVKKLTRNR